MADTKGGRVVETKTSYKTTGTADLPGTVNPTASAAYNNADAPYNHDSNDVSKYIGVTSEYRTYADVRNKPLGVAGDLPAFLPEGLSAEDAPESLSIESSSEEAPVEDDSKKVDSAQAKESTKAAPAPAKPPAAKSDDKTGDSKK